MRAVLVLVVTVGMACATAPPAALTPGQAKLLRGRPRLGVGPKTLEIELKVYGPWHRQVEATGDRLGDLHQSRGEWMEEAGCRRVVIEARRVLDGEDHWRTVDARLVLAEALAQPKRTEEQRKSLQRARDLSGRVIALHGEGKASIALPLAREALKVYEAALGRKHPEYATSLNNLAVLHRSMGDHAAALPLYREALKVTEAALGRKHPQYALSLNNLASLHLDMGDHAAALPLYREALKVHEAALGRKHPDYATSLNNLAMLHQAMGDHAALPLFREALKVREAALGRKHPDYATSLNNLASLHQAMGDHAAALPLLREALKVREAALGRKHPDYAASLNNLAGLHQTMGDHAAALPLFREALKVYEATLGRKHPHYAASLSNLAALHRSMGDHAAAMPLYREALKVREAALGRKHHHYATSLNNLAALHRSMGDHAAAMPLYRKALKVYEAALGRKHPFYATSLNNLAMLHQAMGDHAAAMPLYREALKVTEAALGRRHPSYATNLNNLAALHHAMGRPGAALLLQEQCLAVTRRHLADLASIQSERQQMAAADALRHRLDNRLSLPDEAAHFSHTHVLAWKGSTFAAQQVRRRFVQARSDPQTRELAQKLLDTSRSLALLASRDDPASRQRAIEITEEREEIESQLASISADFRLAVKPPSGHQFRALLPPGVVLVDFLVYDGIDPDRPLWGQLWQRRLAVWVARADAPTVRVDLGPAGPIERDIDAWRGEIERGRDADYIAARLRRTIWAPVEKHLGGAKTVLISPDEGLGRLPFAALPGREKGKVLLEDWPLAVLPIPQVLHRVLDRVEGKTSLLALGGVDFGGGRGTWQPLAATVPEAEAAAARFRAAFKGDVTSLSGAKATRATVHDTLPKHRYAHLATHGYFAPASMRSALDRREREGERPDLFGRATVSGFHPGLLSGVVLAGANAPTRDDDGILRAIEIAEMNLSGVELAVLSACQTGLGKEAGGEGVLGLQRAFAVSGCKTAVTSLWSVDDAATAVLMERFYHHLWEKKLPKLEALRQAQLEVMRHPEWVNERGRKLASVRGLRAIGKDAEVIVAGKKERRSPIAWWAAWQLSGDWR